MKSTNSDFTSILPPAYGSEGLPVFSLALMAEPGAPEAQSKVCPGQRRCPRWHDASAGGKGPKEEAEVLPSAPFTTCTGAGVRSLASALLGFPRLSAVLSAVLLRKAAQVDFYNKI